MRVWKEMVGSGNKVHGYAVRERNGGSGYAGMRVGDEKVWGGKRPVVGMRVGGEMVGSGTLPMPLGNGFKS